MFKWLRKKKTDRYDAKTYPESTVEKEGTPTKMDIVRELDSVEKVDGPIAEQQEAPAPEPEPPKPTWHERLVKARLEITNDGGKLWRQELDDFTTDENAEASTQIMDVVNPVYVTATNKAACPCGSQLSFKECCKQRLQLIRRMWQTWHRGEHEERKIKALERQVEKQETREGAEIDWLCRIGFGPRGEVKVDPLPDAEKYKLRNVCDALDIATWKVRENIIVTEALSQVTRQLREASKISKAMH